MLHIINRDPSRFYQTSHVRHEAETFHDRDGQFHAANERLAHRIMQKLLAHYDCPFWNISAEIEHGIVKIWLQNFSQWPYIIKISTLKADPGLKSVVKAGGELLERFKIPRSSFSVADYLSATRAMPQAFFRNAKAPE